MNLVLLRWKVLLSIKLHAQMLAIHARGYVRVYDKSLAKRLLQELEKVVCLCETEGLLSKCLDPKDPRKQATCDFFKRSEATCRCLYCRTDGSCSNLDAQAAAREKLGE